MTVVIISPLFCLYFYHMKTIELIEANGDLIDNISEILTLDGYNVRVAGDSKELHDNMNSYLPDLVIFDQLNSKNDFLNIVNEIEENQKRSDLPVIVVCSDCDQIFPFAKEVLPHPLSTNGLLMCVKTLLVSLS